MVVVLALALLTLATFGGGAWVLQILRILPELRAAERWSWSFAIGFGVLGWSVFFLAAAGHIDLVPIVAICMVMLTGLVFLRHSGGLYSLVNDPIGGGSGVVLVMLLGLLIVAMSDSSPIRRESTIPQVTAILAFRSPV